MISRSVLALIIALVSTLAAQADETPVPQSARDMLKARLAQEPATAPAKAPTPATTPITPKPNAPLPDSADKSPLLAKPVANAPATDEAAKKKAATQPAEVLPKVEVKKGRITKLDQQLAQQDQDIAREKKNTKISDVDKALNDSKIAKPLAIFGGESSQFRQHVASERVSLMEDEKDLIEAIAHAKTKEEKAALQKQLDELRAERRELEKALR